MVVESIQAWAGRKIHRGHPGDAPPLDLPTDTIVIYSTGDLDARLTQSELLDLENFTLSKSKNSQTAVPLWVAIVLTAWIEAGRREDIVTLLVEAAGSTWNHQSSKTERAAHIAVRLAAQSTRLHIQAPGDFLKLTGLMPDTEIPGHYIEIKFGQGHIP